MTMVVAGQEEAPKVAVRQQRRDDSALRGAPLRPSHFSGLNRTPVDDLHHRRCQPALDDVRRLRCRWAIANTLIQSAS